tara:strand:- start:414 stop:683 length:270 start_codon:yes stop_codon:yes gene_type:complete
MSIDLKGLKKSDIVVRELEGGGFSTKSLVAIEDVNEKGVFIEGCDQDFSDDSTYGYKFDGSPFSCFTFGFKSKILRKATEQDLIDYAEE